MTEKEKVISLIEEKTGWQVKRSRFKIVTDTSDWMRITRGDVIKVGGRYYLIKGNMREPRFGIDDQPKYWVFSAIELESGSEKIIKTVFDEEFYAHIGILKIRCYRDVNKESHVLDLVRGDHRFMQGQTFYDEKGNNVRIIEYIHGTSFFRYIPSIEKSHEKYFREDLPLILKKLKTSIMAIKFLHDNGLCHGDIRNDHIFIDSTSGDYIWIDFDLKQDVSDFDMWSLGNILSYTVAKGIVTFDMILKSHDIPEETKKNLVAEDGSAFYNYRIMNLRKVFPYIPDKLSWILGHFCIQPVAFYNNIDEFIEDYDSMLLEEFSV